MPSHRLPPTPRPFGFTPNRQRTAIILGECKDQGPLDLAEYREAVDGLRQLAQELARQHSIPVTDTELEGAAVLYAFDRSLDAGDLTACEVLAPRAFELMREEEPMYVVLHRKWVEQLMGASRQEAAAFLL